MIVRELRPQHRPVPAPMCQGEVALTPHLRQWRRERMPADMLERCTRSSTWEIDGKHYCALHAGQIALRILAEASCHA